MQLLAYQFYCPTCIRELLGMYCDTLLEIILISSHVRIEYCHVIAGHAVVLTPLFFLQFSKLLPGGSGTPPGGAESPVLPGRAFDIVKTCGVGHLGRFNGPWEAQNEAQYVTYLIVAERLERALTSSSTIRCRCLQALPLHTYE